MGERAPGRLKALVDPGMDRLSYVDLVDMQPARNVRVLLIARWVHRRLRKAMSSMIIPAVERNIHAKQNAQSHLKINESNT